MRAECPEHGLLSPCASFLWVFITAEGAFLMQPAPPSRSSGWGPGLRARPLVEFVARCPSVGPSVRCLGCCSFLNWLHQVRLQPSLSPARPPGRVRLAAPWSCCSHRSRLQAPEAEPRSRWHPHPLPGAPLPEAGGSVSLREDRPRCV